MFVVRLQKSHHASPGFPVAHLSQIHAIWVFVEVLQKSHHASPDSPFAHELQICAIATRLLFRPQKLHFFIKEVLSARILD